MTAKTQNTLNGTATFLIIAMITGALGFIDFSQPAAGSARILFVISLVLFSASLVSGKRLSKNL